MVEVDGVKRWLTSDGSREIVYGQAVHRDEFGIRDGRFWSPDKSRLAFYRMDQSMVTDYPQVVLPIVGCATEEGLGAIAYCAPDKYPMAGQTSHVVQVGVYDLQSEEIVYLQTADPVDRYFTNIAWSPDSRRIYMFELNRAQNDCRLMCYDAQSGALLGELYRETDERYVEPLNPIAFLPWDSDCFVLQSQRDGFNHLYLYDTRGRLLRQLTSGPWVVLELLGFDAERQTIVYQSNELSNMQCNTFSVDMEGRRTLMDNGRGWHHAVLNADGSLRDRYSTPTTPWRDVADDCAEEINTDIDMATAPTYLTGTLLAADDSTMLNYRMVLPRDFDASRRYPTVVYVYGGPHAHLVDASYRYGARQWEGMMAERGYIVFVMDNRGSENRGKVFEQVTYGQLGQVEMADQLRGVDYLLSLPYVDGSRLGIHGWSFGGYMTITLMTNHPELFAVGVAGGPVIDWRWYEVMYGERYMGTPEGNAEGYARTSLLSKAGDLKGRLQIITGYNDATVVPQHCLSFIAECIKAGTQPDFFVYPGEPHNMRGEQRQHLNARITQYFEDYLK